VRRGETFTMTLSDAIIGVDLIVRARGTTGRDPLTRNFDNLVYELEREGWSGGELCGLLSQMYTHFERVGDMVRCEEIDEAIEYVEYLTEATQRYDFVREYPIVYPGRSPLPLPLPLESESESESESASVSASASSSASESRVLYLSPLPPLPRVLLGGVEGVDVAVGSATTPPVTPPAMRPLDAPPAVVRRREEFFADIEVPGPYDEPRVGSVTMRENDFYREYGRDRSDYEETLGRMEWGSSSEYFAYSGSGDTTTAMRMSPTTTTTTTRTTSVLPPPAQFVERERYDEDYTLETGAGGPTFVEQYWRRTPGRTYDHHTRGGSPAPPF
jgi:hypothetical protein